MGASVMGGVKHVPHLLQNFPKLAAKKKYHSGAALPHGLLERKTSMSTSVKSLVSGVAASSAEVLEVMRGELSLAAIHRALSFGTLRVRLMSGSHLPAMDAQGTSDPYVKVSIGSYGSWQSGIVRNTTHPVWEETYEVKGSMRWLVSTPMEVHVYDSDLLKLDDWMGGRAARRAAADGGGDGGAAEHAGYAALARVARRGAAHAVRGDGALLPARPQLPRSA
eukprot:375666-Prymnesium_polylepis.1